MPPHNAVVTIRPRSLANVLADLREAKDDYGEALAAVERQEPDADDRASEAETRCEDLFDEFVATFVDATGMTFKDLQRAVEEAVL
jgi:hypothetical protein